MLDHVVVFDGTSYIVMYKEDVIVNIHETFESFDNDEDAFDLCEELNNRV